MAEQDFLGINLCRFLLQRDYRVRSLDIAPFDYPERHAVEEMQADIRDGFAVERAMAGATHVINTRRSTTGKTHRLPWNHGALIATM